MSILLQHSEREEVRNNFDSDILAGQASMKLVSMGVKLCLPLRSYEIQTDVICSLFFISAVVVHTRNAAIDVLRVMTREELPAGRLH